MPEKKIITLKDFKGGLVTSRYPKEGEFSVLNNWFILNGVLRRRYGMWAIPVVDGAAALLSANMHGFLALTRANGDYRLIGLHQTGLTYIIGGGTSTPLTDAMSLAFGSSSNLWRACQYKNYGYAVRPDLTSIIRFDDTNYWSNGIAAPTTNAVLATGAAGTVAAGNYYGVYTFVDADGVESNPSPVSAIYAAPGGALVAWSSVDVSTNPRVTQRKLYRTFTNQIGEYFYVATINDNTSTTVSEGVGIVDMGDLSPIDNAAPPTKNWVDIATVYERLWVTDGSYVYGSAAEDPDSFPPANVYAFSPDDGQPIRSICRHGDKLVVLKTGSVWALDQSLGEFEFVPRMIDDRNGCTSTHSVVSADGRLFWFSGAAIFMSDGRSPGVDISTGRLDFPTLFDSGHATRGRAAAFPTMGWYIFGTTTESTVYVYDYRRDYWFTITNEKGVKYGATTVIGEPGGYPVFFTGVKDSNGNWQVYGGFSENGGQGAPLVISLFATPPKGNAGDSDGGGASFILAGTATNEIPSTVEFQVGEGDSALLHSISRLLMKCEKSTAPGGADVLDSVTVYMDPHGRSQDISFGNAADSKTRTNITLATARLWKNIGLSSRTRKSSVSAIRVVSTAPGDVPIYGFQIHTEFFAAVGIE